VQASIDKWMASLIKFGHSSWEGGSKMDVHMLKK
jgi:hypothetical protein